MISSAASVIVVADNKVISGAIPATEDCSDPIDLRDSNGLTVQLILLGQNAGLGLSAKVVGCNQRDGTYATVSGGSITVNNVGDVAVLQVGPVPFRYVRVNFLATAGVLVYRAVAWRFCK